MSENKLKIVTDSAIPGQLFLTGEGNSSRLSYLNESGEIIVVSNLTNSPQKPIHCSELYSKLKSRAWNKVDGSRFINLVEAADPEHQNLMYRYYEFLGTDNIPSSDIDTIGEDDYYYQNTRAVTEEGIDIDVLKKTRSFLMSGRVLPDSVGYKELERNFKELFGNMNATEEVYFFNSSKNIVDILNSTITFELIKHNSDTYTDTLGLNELISYSSAPGVSGKVDLTVLYSKGGDIYTHDFTFTAFKYNIIGLENDNFIEVINGDIQLEYIDGVLHVAPIKNGVDECIINNCTITYGNTR